MPETKRIFIIGPMGPSGEPLANIFEIKTALDLVLNALPSFDFRVEIPQEQNESNIAERVFSSIDLSDLVIADIGSRSACVMYELAFAHALGIPVILIDDGRNRADRADRVEPVFYLNQDDTIYLSSRSVDSIRQALSPKIKLWHNDSSAFFMNPLTKFYNGLPLIDASAVAGIVSGYNENFLAPVMRAILDRHNRLKQPEGITPPVGIVVVVPDNLNNLVKFRDDVQKQLEAAFPAARVREPRLVVSREADPPEVRPVMYVGGTAGVVVDVPRTVFPLRRSSRVAKRKSRKEEMEEMERKLLQRFEIVLKETALADKDISQEELHVVRRDTLVKTVEELIFPT